jgi:hypothetical protein
MEVLADKIASIEDPTLRAAAAMETFGRGGSALLPMFAGGAAGIRAMRQEARDLGLTISTDTAAGAAKLNDALGRAKSTIRGIALSIGASLAPIVTDLAERFAKTAAVAIQWIRKNQQIIVTVGKIGLAIVAAGGAITAFGAAIWGLGSVLTAAGVIIGLVGSALALLTSPIGLVTAALVAGAVWWTRYTEDGQRAVETLTGVFGPFAATITKTIQGIVSAITQGKWSEAGTLAGMGLKLAFQDAIEGLFGDSQIKNAIYKLAELFGGGRWAEIGTLAWQGLSESLTIGMETIKANWDLWLQGLSDKLYEQMGFNQVSVALERPL